MVIEFVINMILCIVAISLFNLVRYLLKIRKIIKMNKDNPNIQGITIVNGEVKIIEKQPTSKENDTFIKEMVKDEVCGKEIEKEKSYRVVKDGQEYFFCSWECREQFLKISKQEEEAN